MRRSARVRELHSPLVETLRGILRRGERRLPFPAGHRPGAALYLDRGRRVLLPCNRYTLSRIFGRDLMAPRALATRARHITQTILNSVRR